MKYVYFCTYINVLVCMYVFNTTKAWKQWLMNLLHTHICTYIHTCVSHKMPVLFLVLFCENVVTAWSKKIFAFLEIESGYLGAGIGTMWFHNVGPLWASAILFQLLRRFPHQGLPDFSWHNIPKRGEKCTKLPQHYVPNDRIIYQMAVKYSKWP
jgi:hypothetical protein